MRSIFFLSIFVVSFCCGAFAQKVSDQLSDMDNTGKSLDNSAGSTSAMDTDVVPKADLPEPSESGQAYGGDDNDLPPKVNLPTDMKDIVTDDGTTPAGDYDKVSKGEEDLDADSDLPKSISKQPTVSSAASDSDIGLDAGASGSGEDTGVPAKSQPSDTYGE